MARKHYSLEYREQIVAMVKSGRSITSVATETTKTPGGLRVPRRAPGRIFDRGEVPPTSSLPK